MLTKPELRQHYLNRRQALSPAEVFGWSAKIQNRLMPILAKQQGPVCMYIGMSSRNEINTLPVLVELLRQGSEVWCPVVTRDKTMGMAQVANVTDLDDSHPWGLIQPVQELIRSDLPDFSVILVPGLVWDSRGFRIGYGKGYYDGFLSRSGMQSLKVGLAFQFQIIGSVPIDPWDIPVDILVTENDMIETGNARLSL